MTRQDGRAYDELRPIKITTDFVKFPEGSCLIECGDTKVLCCASIEDKTPPHVAEGTGWVTAEYSMLPRANRERSRRDVDKLKLSGRSAEIQRLIGRSLRAAVDMRRLGERTITVDGDACAKPQNVVVPVGTAYQDILDYVGVKGELGKVVAGGAMMGPAVENLSYPTTKTTSGLILLSKAAAQPAQVNPCIRCGRCVEYCPMGLEPVEVNQAYAARDVQELGKLHADYCFNCGSCSFVCPAKRPVTQMMSLAKAFYLGEIKKGGNK